MLKVPDLVLVPQAVPLNLPSPKNEQSSEAKKIGGARRKAKISSCGVVPAGAAPSAASAAAKAKGS